MTRISKFTDIWKSQSIPKYIADSMEKQLYKLCKEWLVEDISSLGSFFYIEQASDLDNYHETGMTQRIEEAEPEFFKLFKDEESGSCCYQICHIVDDSYAIYVFCEHNILMDLIRQDTENSCEEV